MTPLRHLAITVAPFLFSGACAQLIGLSDYEKGDVSESGGEGGEGGLGGNRGGNGGSSGSSRGGSGGRGGSRTGGDGGMAGENTGGDAGDGAAGMGGEPMGGQGGVAPRGGTAGGGMGGNGGSAGGGTGGSAGGMNCGTVPVSVENSSFDDELPVWIPWSEGAAIPIMVTGESLGITAESPPNVGRLGGAHELYSGQFQTITIPAGAITMTLTGYRQVVTEEDPEATDAFDYMAIQMWEDALNPSDETHVGEFVFYSNMNPTNGWTQFTGSTTVSAYAGQTVDLDMWAFTDDTLITHFYVDSLALSALVCQ